MSSYDNEELSDLCSCFISNHHASLTQLLPRDVRSAKRGIAVVTRSSVCPSVCLSVCNVDYRVHIGWTSSKVINE